MIVRCKRCFFYYAVNFKLRCPLCSEPAPLWACYALGSSNTQIVPFHNKSPVLYKGFGGLYPGQLNAELVMQRAFGGLYHLAQFPLLLAAAVVINTVGKLRDPMVDYMKGLNYCMSLPTSLSWQWTPSFEGASQLKFNKHIDDESGSVKTVLQLDDLPLGTTFFSPKRRQQIYFKNISTNGLSGFFGCIDTEVRVKDQLLGHGQDKQLTHWAQLVGKTRFSQTNKLWTDESWLFDYTGLVLDLNFVQVQYLGDFMAPSSLFVVKKLANHMKYKTRHEMNLKVKVKAERIDVGVDWGRLQLTVPIAGEADMDMVLLDEPIEDSPNRIALRGEGNVKMTKFNGYKLPAWGIFRRSVKVEGIKTPSGRMTFKEIKPIPQPDEFRDFLERFGPI